MPLTQKQFETLETDLVKQIIKTSPPNLHAFPKDDCKELLQARIESPKAVSVEYIYDKILEKQEELHSFESGYSVVITDGQKILLFCNFKPYIASLWAGKGVNLKNCCLVDITNGFEIIPDDVLVHFNLAWMLLLTQPYIDENFVTNKIKFIPFRKVLSLNPDVYKHVIDLEEVKAYYHRAKLFKEVVCR